MAFYFNILPIQNFGCSPGLSGRRLTNRTRVSDIKDTFLLGQDLRHILRFPAWYGCACWCLFGLRELDAQDRVFT